jgi:hypothetical protein
MPSQIPTIEGAIITARTDVGSSVLSWYGARLLVLVCVKLVLFANKLVVAGLVTLGTNDAPNSSSVDATKRVSVGVVATSVFVSLCITNGEEGTSIVASSLVIVNIVVSGTVGVGVIISVAVDVAALVLASVCETSAVV